MELPAFQYHRPRTAQEAVGLLARYAGDVDVVAGGTDLLPNYKNRLNNRGHVVSLVAVEGLDARRADYLGAKVRLVELERDEGLRAALPGLVEAAAAISSPPLREHGTVGGNLMLDTRCHYFNQSAMWRASVDHCLKASGEQCLVVPASDGRCYATYSGELAAPLLTYDASLVLLSAEGEREVPLAEFFHHDGIVRFNDRRPEELLVGVRIPPRPAGLRSGYAKLRIRDSIDFPSLGVAAALALDEAGRLAVLRVATVALTSRPESFDEVVAPFLGRSPSPELALQIGEAVTKAAKAYNNVPLDPKYRRKMAGVFTRRLLARLEPGFASAGS